MWESTIQGLLSSVLEMFGQTQVPAVVTNNLGEIERVNSYFLTLTCYKTEELFGKKYISLEGVEDLVEIANAKKSLEHCFGHHQGHVVIVGKNQKEHFCRISIVKVTSLDMSFYLKQYQVLNHDSALDYKDLVLIRNTMIGGLGEIKDVAVLCAKLSMDYRKVLFLIRKFEGITPKQYLDTLRMEKCLRMLKKNDRSLKEIAWELGYCDLAHMCNFFKQKMNMTIGEYMRMN